jgi:hypothetical protein
MPEVLGMGLWSEECERVLRLWRDGHVRWVVNRWLLVRYLRLLGRLGVAPDVIRWWSWWLADPARVVYLDNTVVPDDPYRTCSALARMGGATALVYATRAEEMGCRGGTDSVRWVHVSAFIAEWAQAQPSGPRSRLGVAESDPRLPLGGLPTRHDG